MAGALKPIRFDAWVWLAAKVRAALIQRADIESRAVARCVFTRYKLLAIRIDQHDEGARILYVGWVPLCDWESCVGVDQ